MCLWVEILAQKVGSVACNEERKNESGRFEEERAVLLISGAFVGNKTFNVSSGVDMPRLDRRAHSCSVKEKFDSSS